MHFWKASPAAVLLPLLRSSLPNSRFILRFLYLGQCTSIVVERLIVIQYITARDLKDVGV